MNFIIFLGLVAPIVYLMRVIRRGIMITRHVLVKTILISVVGFFVTSLISLLVLPDVTFAQGAQYMIATIVVGVIWALLLCGCYYLLQRITHRK